MTRYRCALFFLLLSGTIVVQAGGPLRVHAENPRDFADASGRALLLAVPGLDGVLIGPHDLSCSLGVPEQYDHPDFLAACERIFRRARAAGVGAGIHFWGDVAQQRRFLELGASFLIHSADISLFQKHLRADLAAIRRAAGLTPDRDGPSAALSV